MPSQPADLPPEAEPSPLPPSPPSVAPPETPLDPVPVAPRVRRRRGGRDLPAAIGVGLTLAAVVLAALYVEKRAFLGLACAAVVLALWELVQAFHVGRVHPPRLPVAVGAVGMLVAAYVGGVASLAVALLLTALAVILWRVKDGPAGYVADVSAGVFLAVYLPFLAGFAMLMLRAADGADRIVVFILLTACSDVGGYAIGYHFGRHPLAPAASPKKSWEGLAGSVVVAALGGAITVPLLLGAASPWDVAWAGVLLGGATAVMATLGDLAESLIKRDVGIKDMSTLLPGHGGLMDRLDSLLLTAPVAYLLLTWLVPPG